MRTDTYGSTLRIVNVTSLATSEPLHKLVATALAAMSPAKSLPDGEVIQVALTPSADIEVADFEYGDEMTVSERTLFPVENALEVLMLKNSATVNVEIYFKS